MSGHSFVLWKLECGFGYLRRRGIFQYVLIRNQHHPVPLYRDEGDTFWKD
jgi:hypothetical protein